MRVYISPNETKKEYFGGNLSGEIECLYYQGASNNSFNRSANSMAFIENLNLSALCARPVNSGVRLYVVRMIHSVNIRTDDRVADIVRHFEAAPGWEVIGAIDSVNWGEGYDLRWRGVPVRLHDDVRSDEVMRRSRGICEPEEWSQLFQIVAGEMSGEVELTVAIDYWGEASPELYPAVAEAIRAVLVRAGYNQASIRAEASC